MTTQTQKLLMMLTIGVLIGIVTVNIFSTEPVDTESGESTTATGVVDKDISEITTTGEKLSASGKNTLPPSVPLNSRVGLTVNDQPQDAMVQVSGLKVEVASWVAIYDEREGKPSVILGAQKVRPGETTTTVELLRREGTEKGMTYYAGILPDDGDGVFNRLTDLPPFSPEKFTIVKFTAI